MATKPSYEELEQRVKELDETVVDHKRDEEDSHAQEKDYFRYLISNLHEDIVVINRDYKIIDVNDSFLKTNGYNREEVIGYPCYTILHGHPKKCVRYGEKCKLHEMLATENPSSYVHIHKTKDGSKIWVDLILWPLKYGKEDILHAVCAMVNISDLMAAKESLGKREKELEEKTNKLNEMNCTLKVLLNNREECKSEIEENILSNLHTLIEPNLGNLKKGALTGKQKNLIEILENNLNEIVSPFSYRLSSQYYYLTTSEIRVADLVKQGNTNKEIAEILHIAPRTIAFHRENIRKKLGLKNKKTNLRTHLLFLD